ncbi:HNH endonuclease [Siphonobacter sp. SORGH_AS_1065]|uniref:HNH endonuclease n=1 Tax=Siphonobacter sp. SORGH_AS_1065 TaxID=3041795 RepID=UPI0027816882|nr:HNH endonuclease [Siphonobacter sp. SORGH_AS_1065]MDQ1090094.1 5-methylcytosine-specific restriction protein A [Siphonobacter sp. SORGH_AS_1065]
MKNPSWQRDELILALNLYFTIDYNQLSSKHPEIVKLSILINKLPIFSPEQRTHTFRNSQGVYMKLGNFVSIDPNDTRRGLPGFGKLDKEVFFEFFNKKDELLSIATTIINSINNEKLIGQINDYQKLIDHDFTVREGKVMYGLHSFRERNSAIIKKKKEYVFKKENKLQCEVCEFDFVKAYGELGVGFIECHHIKPLSSLQEESITAVEDLALVCANCHRMLHRDLSLTIEELRMRMNVK